MLGPPVWTRHEPWPQLTPWPLTSTLEVGRKPQTVLSIWKCPHLAIRRWILVLSTKQEQSPPSPSPLSLPRSLPPFHPPPSVTEFCVYDHQHVCDVLGEADRAQLCRLILLSLLSRISWITSPAATSWCSWLGPSCCSRWLQSTPCWGTWCACSWWGRYLAIITPGKVQQVGTPLLSDPLIISQAWEWGFLTMFLLLLPPSIHIYTHPSYTLSIHPYVYVHVP